MQTNTDCDVIMGAEAIASVVFGNPSMRRKVFHLASRGELPGAFKLGGKLALSRKAHNDGIAALAAAYKRAA